MARYRGTVQGQRGQASRLGGKSSGIVVKAGGWDIGAEVVVQPCTCGEDLVEVFRTGGSNRGDAVAVIARYHAEGKACSRFPDGAGL